jgi:hypothetical protein
MMKRGRISLRGNKEGELTRLMWCLYRRGHLCVCVCVCVCVNAMCCRNVSAFVVYLHEDILRYAFV